MIKKLQQSGIRIVALGTNTIDLKRGKLRFDNSRRRNAIIELYAKEISQELSAETGIEAIRALILHHGEEVARLVPYEDFKAIKSLQKQGNLADYCDEQGAIDFNRVSSTYYVVHR